MSEKTLQHNEEVTIKATSVTLQNMSQDRSAACNLSGDVSQNVQLEGGERKVIDFGGDNEVTIHNSGKPAIKVTW